MRRFNDWIRRKGSDDTGFGHLIQLLYHIFGNSYIQMIVGALGFLLGLLNQEERGIKFYILVSLYMLSMSLITWANQHIRHKIRDTKAFQRSLYYLSESLRSRAVALQMCAKQLRKHSDKMRSSEIIENCQIDFQSAAFDVCKKLRDALSTSDFKNDVYVTVFQKAEDGGKAYCQMIAYSEEHEVTSYGERYPIPENFNGAIGSIEYHSYVFAKEIKEVTTLYKKEQITEYFIPHKKHEKSEEREKNIQQYICIPISPAKLGVTFLLQVDTSIPWLFGETESAVNDFAKNTIYPYAQLLHLLYEQSRVINTIK